MREREEFLERKEESTVRGPRDIEGSISGPGGPRDRNAVVVDASEAVLVDNLEVTMIESFRKGVRGSPSIALWIEGRINQSTDRASIVCLIDEDGAAAFVTEIVGLATRATSFAPEFLERLQSRLADM